MVVDLEEPLGGAPVEPDLVDRLPGADVAQLGRTVGGEHEQRHPRLVRLDAPRARSSPPPSPTCRPTRRGTPVALASPSAKNAAGPLVDVRRRAQRGIPRERQRQRRRTRARRGARVAQAAADELVDEGAQAEVSVGSGHDETRMLPPLVLLHGFTQTRQSLAAHGKALG